MIPDLRLGTGIGKNERCFAFGHYFHYLRKQLYTNVPRPGVILNIFRNNGFDHQLFLQVGAHHNYFISREIIAEQYICRLFKVANGSGDAPDF